MSLLSPYLLQGEFGVVHRGILQEPGKLPVHVALKSLSSPDQAERIRLLRESMLMATLSHTNILKLLGVVTATDPIVLILEYMPDGALDGIIRVRDFPLQQLLKFALEIDSAMVYLSDNRYIHRDLAAYACTHMLAHPHLISLSRRNVLVSGTSCKVCDFGFSHELESGREYYETKTRLPLRYGSNALCVLS